MGRLRIAASLPERARGLLLRQRDWLGPGGVLLLVPCASIHTFLMREPIDLAFIGADGRVLHAQEGVGSGRVVSCPGALAAVERFTPLVPESGLADPWFACGEFAGLGPVGVELSRHFGSDM